MMPMKAVRVSTFIALSSVAKSLLSSVPAMHSSTSPTTGPKPCRRRSSAARGSRECEGWRRGVGAACQCVPVAWAISSSSVSCSAASVACETAGAHHRDAVAQADQLHQFGRDHDHGAALAGEPLDQEVDVALGADVDAARRLVEHDHPRLGLQHLRERELLLVAAGQRRGARVERAGADAVVGRPPLQRRPLGVGLAATAAA